MVLIAASDLAAGPLLTVLAEGVGVEGALQWVKTKSAFSKAASVH
jgi:hypothetical protein